MIRFVCPHCRAVVTAPPERAGKKAKCPKCQFVLEVPTPKGELIEDKLTLQAPQWTPPPVPAEEPFSFDALGACPRIAFVRLK